MSGNTEEDKKNNIYGVLSTLKGILETLNELLE